MGRNHGKRTKIDKTTNTVELKTKQLNYKHSTNTTKSVVCQAHKPLETTNQHNCTNREQPAGPEELLMGDRSKTKKVKQQIKDLSLYVSLARIPVELQIRSDRKTDITVYRVATLGKIYQTSMELIPGAYTIVGTRKGYRDVHENLTLLGGRGAVSVDVSCTEKI